MEHCFRFALWMCLLIGYLQAKPVSTENSRKWERIDIPNLGLDLLREEVKCGTNVTFIAPKNVKKPCYTAALECFIVGLEEAQENCTNAARIGDTLEEIRDWYCNGTECRLPSQCENTGPRQEFGLFLNTMEAFFTQLNSQ